MSEASHIIKSKSETFFSRFLHHNKSFIFQIIRAKNQTNKQTNRCSLNAAKYQLRERLEMLMNEQGRQLFGMFWWFVMAEIS